MIGGSRHALKTLTGRGATAAAAALQNEAFHRKMAACSDTLQEQKKALRKVLKAKLRQMSAEDMQAESETSQVFAATCPLMVVRGGKIAQHVLQSPYFKSSKRVGVYLHCAALREVDTALLVDSALQRGDARCYVPLVLDQAANMRLLHLESREGLTAGPPYYISEPMKEYPDGQQREDALEMDEPLDLLLMPGLAFDRKGRRCGRGGGYYDKYLSLCQDRGAKMGWHSPLLVALAFRAQMVEEVPVGENDRPVDLIVTADGTFAASARGAAAMS